MANVCQRLTLFTLWIALLLSIILGALVTGLVFVALTYESIHNSILGHDAVQFWTGVGLLLFSYLTLFLFLRWRIKSLLSNMEVFTRLTEKIKDNSNEVRNLEWRLYWEDPVIVTFVVIVWSLLLLMVLREDSASIGIAVIGLSVTLVVFFYDQYFSGKRDFAAFLYILKCLDVPGGDRVSSVGAYYTQRSRPPARCA